jgi:hypothetical protein
VSPKISSPQPSHILQSISQRPTSFRQLRDQFQVDFQAAFPDKSFDFEEVPSHLARHNLIIPDYMPPPELVSEQHLWHSISLS